MNTVRPPGQYIRTAKRFSYQWSSIVVQDLLVCHNTIFIIFKNMFLLIEIKYNIMEKNKLNEN